MAIFGGGGRMNAYGEPLVDSTVGEALGGLLGRGTKKFKDSLFDDKGLVRANPDGPDMPILGKKKGLDRPDSGLFQLNEDESLRLGKYKGLDILKGKGYLGKDKGFDKPYLANLVGGVGSRLRSMFGGKQDPDDFTEAGGGTYNTVLPEEKKTLFNKKERIEYNPQEVMSSLKKGMDVRTLTSEQLGPLQQLMKDETSEITNKPFYEGAVDSIYGPQTQKAFDAFMKSRGLYEEPIEEYKGDGPVYTEPSSRLGAMLTPQGVYQN